MIGNVGVDVLVDPVDRLPPPGGDLLVDRIEIRPAGAAGNVSLAMHALAAEHRVFGLLGDDTGGDLVRAHFERIGLSGDLSVRPGATSTSIAVEAPGRERAFWTTAGVLADQDLDSLGPEAGLADLVLVTGYFSCPGLAAQTGELLRRVRRNGGMTLFDTGWDPEDWTGGGAQRVRDLLTDVDVFLPNEPEAYALTGADNLADAARDLLDLGPAWVVAKAGPAGAVVAGRGAGRVEGSTDPVSITTVPAPPVDPAVVTDTTGAGDSLAAGLLAALRDGTDFLDAVGYGVRVASVVVTGRGTERYPDRNRVPRQPKSAES